MASRSLPDLSILTSSDANDDLETTAPPSPPRSDSPSPCSPLPGESTPSRSPSPWDHEYLQRTPNGRRDASFDSNLDLDLPPDLRDELTTPKGDFRTEDRSRSDSPWDRLRREGKEEEEEDEDRDQGGSGGEPGTFSLHHDGPSEYSIHSAPAEFDSPRTEGDNNAYPDSPSSPMSQPVPLSFDPGPRSSTGAFHLPFSLYEYLQVGLYYLPCFGCRAHRLARTLRRK